MSPPNITKEGLGDNVSIRLMMAVSTSVFTGSLSESPRLSARKTKRSVSSVPPSCSGLLLQLVSMAETTISSVTATMLKWLFPIRHVVFNVSDIVFLLSLFRNIFLLIANAPPTTAVGVHTHTSHSNSHPLPRIARLPAR
jgi:hypothetical protein